MQQKSDDLYTRYTLAISFFNARRPQPIQLRTLSAQEFHVWWARISKDPNLKARWLFRFEDPQRAFAAECEIIARELDLISIRRAA
jgi:hypothetical protein